MRLKIAARKSDLARLQAYEVGAALKAAHPQLEIQYNFRESLGDANLNDPLWKMPEKGVFTEDFVADLQSGAADLVVHSFKDLPTADRPYTEIVAALPRADQRDLLLIRKDKIPAWQQSGRLRIYTSSPRRGYNLKKFLPEYLPHHVRDLEFLPVRGNIATRIRKFLQDDVDGLVVAKAAIDRLTQSAALETLNGVRHEDFGSSRLIIKQALQECRFMVLPLSLNPAAAAQGALAIEIKRGRKELSELIARINDTTTFVAAQAERETLASYGGGCHQKIGVAKLIRAYGTVTSLRGLTDSGERLEAWALQAEGAKAPKAKSASAVFPDTRDDQRLYGRQFLPVAKYLERIQSSNFLWVTREMALPKNIILADDSVVWTSGLATWKKCAERGIWVCGSSEGLGETEEPRIEALTGVRPNWVKLSHQGAPASGMELIATYTLNAREQLPELSQKTHFFWMSGSSFDFAVARFPQIREAYHACGPGHTLEHLRHEIPANRLHVYLNYSDWRREILPAARSAGDGLKT